MNTKPFISFILPNYNNEHVLNLFFEKFIINNTYDNYEFIIVDDGSEDCSLEVLYSWKNSGKINNMLIIEEPHLGIINALNKALFLSKGEFIIRCDGDATIETQSFVEKFLEFYYIEPEKIGVITSKVIADNGWLHALGRSVISPNGLLDRGKIPTEKIGFRSWDYKSTVSANFDNIVNKPAEIDTALGVFTFFRRDIALKIGGFDKNYPLWIEDDDFFLMFRLYNKKCFYLPNIEICHRFSLRGNRNPDSWKKRYFNFIKTIDDEVQLTRSYYFFGKLKIFERKYISWRPKILLHNYNYWRRKWGFDCLNPNMEVVKKLYKDTEILWNYDIKLRNEGDWIINEYTKLNHTNIQL
ncbi:glycosyltransferase family 2 protein [Campylobacter sp. RKI_CA19_01116]|uniref:glycosyltransferase family 2 protein n=1 Tax=Campylobacter sp. RKI_CA19_01116 TaxID=2911625 RepID=UPI0021E86F5A|nr:glycosyltransferase family 2 protein [Campylobacter sp. RKI_CA19_01116]MCV3396615.1 glycosyltransferase [Campylobacter sp. RKI_CA19_01116]